MDNIIELVDFDLEMPYLDKISEEVTVTPSNSKQVITPQDEYHELKKVTVEAVTGSGSLKKYKVQQVMTGDNTCELLITGDGTGEDLLIGEITDGDYNKLYMVSE